MRRPSPRRLYTHSLLHIRVLIDCTALAHDAVALSIRATTIHVTHAALRESVNCLRRQPLASTIWFASQLVRWLVGSLLTLDRLCIDSQTTGAVRRGRYGACVTSGDRATRERHCAVRAAGPESSLSCANSHLPVLVQIHSSPHGYLPGISGVRTSIATICALGRIVPIQSTIHNPKSKIQSPIDMHRRYAMRFLHCILHFPPTNLRPPKCIKSPTNTSNRSPHYRAISSREKCRLRYHIRL